MNKLRLVYGTLRKGYGLHISVGLSDNKTAKYLGEVVLDGFEMWTNGGYPMIKRGKGKITAELYEVKDSKALNDMDMIEIGAGYKVEEETINLNGNSMTAGIYVYKYDTNRLAKVEGGDFNETRRY